MAKIIEISETVISIGMDDGSIKEVRPADLSFAPCMGDEVEIFETESRTIVRKKEASPQQETAEGGIHINVANTQTVPQATTMVVSGKVVNKVVYCVLAFLLGGIGIHKFYAGKTGAGICFLLFCWTGIPLIISLIDGITALCKHADAAGNIII